MNIVFDLDNTLIDEQGKTIRPGAIKLLNQLRLNHKLILWTNSKRSRTMVILGELNLKHFFSKILCREDYDLDGQDGCKDLRKVKGDLIIDDNPEQAVYAKKYGYKAIIVNPFTSFRTVEGQEFIDIADKIKAITSKPNFFNNFFNKF